MGVTHIYIYLSKQDNYVFPLKPSLLLNSDIKLNVKSQPYQ